MFHLQDERFAKSPFPYQTKFQNPKINFYFLFNYFTTSLVPNIQSIINISILLFPLKHPLLLLLITIEAQNYGYMPQLE